MNDQEKNKRNTKQTNKIDLDYDYLMITHRRRRILFECSIRENGLQKCQCLINLPLAPSVMAKIDDILERYLTLRINESKQQPTNDTDNALLGTREKNQIQSKSSIDRSRKNVEGGVVV